MWVRDLPPVEANLRQGDLLVGIPFPRIGTVTVDDSGLTGDVDLDVTALVIEHCCNIQQKHVLTLARVKSQSAGDRELAALNNVEPTPGQPYARYKHLLAPHAALPTKRDKIKVVNLLDRVHLFEDGEDAFQALREARRARMTVVSRAHLRLKLTIHFGRPSEEDDLPELEALGLDEFGLPVPPKVPGPPR